MGHFLRTSRHGRLVLLNVALFALLAVVLAIPAGAQNTGAPGAQGVTRARGDYTMISGKTTSGSNSAVYIIDSVNQELIALRWETGRKSFVGLGYRNLDTDSKALPGR